MPNLLKNKKLLVNVLVVLLIIAGAVSLFYFQTRINETCEKKLEGYSTNHLCISTSKGLMVFELYQDGGPIAISKMKTLANDEKFYDGLEFYRVSKDFVIQGGVQDLEARTAGYDVNDSVLEKKLKLLGENKFDVETNFEKLGLAADVREELVNAGYKTDEKINARKFEYGSLAFANSGATGNTTEFFIVTSKNASDANVANLNGRYTNFGKIVEGQDVLDSINSAKINLNYPIEFSQDQSKPAEYIAIYEIRVK